MLSKRTTTRFWKREPGRERHWRIWCRRSAAAARGNFDGDEIAAGAALSEGYSLLAEALGPQFEGGGDEGALELLCVAKMNQMADQALLKGMDELDAFQQIKQWAKLTERATARN
jgi:hypothetical protein